MPSRPQGQFSGTGGDKPAAQTIISEMLEQSTCPQMAFSQVCAAKIKVILRQARGLCSQTGRIEAMKRAQKCRIFLVDKSFWVR